MLFLVGCLFFVCAMTHNRLEGNVLTIGHRGACGYAEENSLNSFGKALEIGVDAVELDVHLTQTGELVVIHDETVDRVSDGKGAVGKHTLEELKRYRLKEGGEIPTLDQVCDLIDGQCIVNIELKGISTAGPVAKFIADRVIKEGWTFDQFFVSSFDHHELFAFHQLLPQVQTGALLEGIPLRYASFAEDVGATHVVLYYLTVNKAFIQDAHSRGLKVFVYTVDSLEDIKNVIDMGVDGIISNYPDRVVSMREVCDVGGEILLERVLPDAP